MNTTDFLNIAHAICPDRELMVFDGKRWTFDQTNDRVNRLANALIGLGVTKEDRVGILQVNCHQYIETYFAIAKIGAIHRLIFGARVGYGIVECPIVIESHGGNGDEQLENKQIYDEFYPNTAKTIPYFWMPKYVNAKDASARTLDFYNE